jgi:hypothetical protein
MDLEKEDEACLSQVNLENEDDAIEFLSTMAGFLIHGLEEVGELVPANDKQPCRTSILSGSAYVQELLEGHVVRFQETLGMQKATFRALCHCLRLLGLNDSQYVAVEEQVSMFLTLTRYNHSNRILQERFQHSGETVHQ